jgi:hypothetical protein
MADPQDFMAVLETQNKILAEQNLLLKQIVSFITPVSAFFAAFKNFVIFMSWLVGTVVALIAAWQWGWHWIVDWVKTH